ncbi:MAG: cell division FtsA domain-containing protein [Bacilli bacterium]|jgi:cell division protein FtsA|nr:cell division FtsA domain-containing protein [Bacilli bacterium]
MEKPVAVIEFTSRLIRIVVGFTIDEEVYILYALEKPIGPFIENGRIINEDALVEEVKSIANISDPSAKLKIKLTNAVLALPPLGLEIFQTKRILTVINEEGKIDNLDIRNLYTVISRDAVPNDDIVVGVIPEEFILDHERSFKNPPVGESSDSITVNAKVHTLPKSIAESYQTSLTRGGIALRRTFVAPFGVAELLATYQEVPADYILVDIGARLTTISLVGKKKLYGANYINWGGDNITDAIARDFKINISDAEKYKIMYGYDKREMNFEAPVCTSEDENGLPIKRLLSEMNVITKEELDSFIKKLNIAIEELLKDYEPGFRSLPMIVIGGGSQLYGLKEYMEPKVQSQTVKMITPKTIGARSPNFFTCLGLIKANSKFPHLSDDGQQRIRKVTRTNTSEDNL